MPASAGAGAGATDGAAATAVAAAGAALEPGDFVWLKNARFNPSRESPTNPAKWVGRIAAFVPPGQYKLRWMRETETSTVFRMPLLS